jgi:hypothetical protein
LLHACGIGLAGWLRLRRAEAFSQNNRHGSLKTLKTQQKKPRLHFAYNAASAE